MNTDKIKFFSLLDLEMKWVLYGSASNYILSELHLASVLIDLWHMNWFKELKKQKKKIRFARSTDVLIFQTLSITE